ncbi:ATP-dependent nuclease [Sphingobium bisphenolivorans]|uniref:ATP-dependent nuclease n=1 Tax=Sphingobium bisphenolivorans TaxID=1335760 RepID=UPI0003A19810|nr:ATP-binding protein [Sphingobium bisphenolivorans]
MQIEKIRVRNFKRVSDLTLELGDLTYLVGGNNSGKSSVLQAVHMAVSCAQRSAELQQVVIAESMLRYCPTGEFQRLGNSGPYENRKDGSRGTVDLSGKTSDGADASYKVEIYKARNHHNVGVERTGVYTGFGQYICDPQTLFSVYVPGLAGIPHNEELQSYASVFQKAAGGEANLVFRNIVRLIREKGLLQELEDLLFDVVGPCKFKADYDSERERYVDLQVSFKEGAPEDSFVPMDLSGTGVIQITQIFAYVILFRPKVLLVDEPDSHLHPSRQALLSTAFTKIVSRYKCKVIVSTHSRHLVSSAPPETRLVWLREGRVEKHDEKGGLTSMLLDLGALDQIDSKGADYLICTEDAGKKNLEKCVKALGKNINVKVISYNGVSNAASAAVIKEMAAMFHNQPEIIIHRDRDFLTDTEVDRWAEPYEKLGLSIFCPVLPDIESYYVTEEHVTKIYEKVDPKDVSLAVAQANDAVEAEMRRKFKDKRQQANLHFWRDGGSPRTEDLWDKDAPMKEEFTLGKLLLPHVNSKIREIAPTGKDLFKVPSSRLVDELARFLKL